MWVLAGLRVRVRVGVGRQGIELDNLKGGESGRAAGKLNWGRKSCLSSTCQEEALSCLAEGRGRGPQAQSWVGKPEAAVRIDWDEGRHKSERQTRKRENDRQPPANPNDQSDLILLHPLNNNIQHIVWSSYSIYTLSLLRGRALSVCTVVSFYVL